MREFQRGLASWRRAAPSPATAFESLHRTAMAEGAMSARNKELAAIAASVATSCEGCISWHVDAARRLGSSQHEIAEAISVGVVVASGKGAFYATLAFAATDEGAGT